MSDQAESPKRGRGRPPKYAGEGRRQNFSFRIRDKVREWLIAAVAESGRSLSEEIEHRLEMSVARRDHVREDWGHDVFAIGEGMARSLRHIERMTGKDWVEDEETFDLFKQTTAEIVRNYRDLVLRNRRETPHGSFDDKSPEELAQMFAALGGIAPPRPHAASAEADAAFRAKNLRTRKEKSS